MSIMRIAVLGVAIGAAGLAAYVANGFLNTPESVPVVVNNIPSTKVLMASANVEMGEKLAGSITWQDWPEKSVSPGMITQAAQPDADSKFADARARQGIYEGEPILEKKLVLPNDNGFMAAILPKGMRAIAVPVTVESGAGGFILPNDRVDVLLTRKLQIANTDRSVVSETVLTNVRVLALDQTFRQEGDGEKYVVATKTALLELDPKQTEIVSMAGDQGKLSLTLRSIAENDGSNLADAGPKLSEKYARGGGDGSDLTVIRYGVSRQYTSN